MAPRSKVEISGWLARHYDLALDLVSLGRYQHLMARIVAKMQIRQGDAILDLGCGTGRNIPLMLDAAGPTARVVGVDISEVMLRRARRRCQAYPHVSFLQQRIEQRLPFEEEFDKVSLSWVLHGFEDEDKQRIVANARRALKPEGTLWILDYNEFELSELCFPARWLFTRFECELAGEFIGLDLSGMLCSAGFESLVSHEFLRGYLRLLGARKSGTSTSDLPATGSPSSVS